MPQTEPDNETLTNLTNTYSTQQSTLQTLVSARQKLESQQSENEAVSREFDILDKEDGEERNIYKMAGPVLVKQDKVEAQEAVKARLGWIRGEKKRLECQLAECEAKSEKLKMEIIQLQSETQRDVEAMAKSQQARQRAQSS